jgi:hypothetical protein
MTSLKFNFGPDLSAEADWFTVLVGAGLIFALVWLFLHHLTSKTSPTNSWDMPVVGSGTADEPSRVELLPHSPVLISD